MKLGGVEWRGWLERFLSRKTRSLVNIGALDGVRGWAAVLVLLGHGSYPPNLVSAPPLQWFDSTSGRIGVYLFFVLSAFLLTLPFVGRTGLVGLGWRTWAVYGSRRFFRIYPLLVVVVLVMWLCGLLPFGGMFVLTTQEAWGILLFQIGPHHLWTILVECTYYLLLPLVVVVLRMAAFAGIGGVTVAVIGLVWGADVWAKAGWGPGPTLEFWKCASLFFIGSGMAWWHGWLGVGKRGWATPLVVVTLLLMFYEMPRFRGLFGLGESADLLGFDPWWGWGVLLGLFLLGVLRSRFFSDVIFGSAFLRFWGVISYSLYLWHLILLRPIKNILPGGALEKSILYFVLSTLLAVASYWWIERPLSRVNWPRFGKG
jgi:peptidoglycan/LPS O-acetylase OafA/YrhL